MNVLAHPKIKFDYAGLFQSDREWIHPERIGKNYEIIYMVHGEMYICEDEQEYHLERGQALLLSPGRPHRGTRTTTQLSFYWVHFSMNGPIPFSRRFFDSLENPSLFKELLHVNNLPSVPEYLVNSVLVHLLSALCHASGEHEPRYDVMAEKIYEWVRINATAKLTVKAIAEHFGYSEDHTSRICKKNYGIGAKSLINRFLLSRAKELLSNTNKYVKEIASALEFVDDKAFIGYFKYHENCSPTEFRNRFSRLHMNSK